MGFSPAQPQQATPERYRATLRLRSGSSRYRTNGKCWLSGHRSQRTPRDRSSRKGRSKRAQPEHGHALTSRSLALPAPSLALGRARGWHRRVATLLIRSRRQACAGEHPLLQNRHHARKMGLEGIVSKRLGRATGRAGRRTCLATSRTFAASPINGHHLKLRVIGGWASWSVDRLGRSLQDWSASCPSCTHSRSIYSCANRGSTPRRRQARRWFR